MSRDIHNTPGASDAHAPPDSTGQPSLQLIHGEDVIFSSHGSWLHPLFELERFLADARADSRADARVDPRECVLRDKLIGKAAALLIVRMGFVRVNAGILSGLGEAVLTAHRVRYEAEQRVDRILCRTEELLADVDDPDEAYRFIRDRIERAGAWS